MCAIYAMLGGAGTFFLVLGVVVQFGSYLFGFSPHNFEFSRDIWPWLLSGGFYFATYSYWRSQQDGWQGKLDLGVDNTIVAWSSRWGCYLVAAENIHRIQGYNTHVTGNLPASIHFYARHGRTNLYVVAPTDFLDTPGGSNDVAHRRQRNEFGWEPMQAGQWEIVPRGAGIGWDGFLADQMAGYDYSYVRPKGERPYIGAHTHKGNPKRGPNTGGPQ